MEVSIIIPHKNSSELLERLLKSVPRIEKSEIIVVDDHSDVYNRKIINELANNYEFKLFDNEGEYAGGARNTGLKYATGKWVVFADSDDYFTEEANNIISDYLLSEKDIIFFNVISKFSDTGEQAYRADHIQSILGRAYREQNLDVLRCCYTVPWGKMIKRQLILEKNLKFDEVIAGNDMMFSVMSGILANSVGFDERMMYCVTVTFGSITTTLTKDRFESRFKVTLAVNNILRKYGYGSYQISVLYFIAKSYQFGIKYVFHVVKECIKNRSNIFIGAHKLLNISSVLKDRQNRENR